MELRGQFGLGSRVAQALGNMLVDRVEEGWGRALPRTPEQIADPESLNALVREYAPKGEPQLSPIGSAWLPGVDFESSNCTNFLVELEFEGDAIGNAPRPRTVYVKLPCPEVATRAFANAVGFWEVETAFCQRVASQVPIRVPRVYAAARKGARFVLLLENLYETPGVRLFLNRDMAAGTDLERARMCLQTFAELHSGFWGWTASEREDLVPLRLHLYLAPGGREMTRALNEAAIAPARRKASDLFLAEHAAICRQAIEKWDALVDYWYSDPLTLIHGDSHLANFFEYPGPGGPKMGMLDFQGMHWCQGIRDVQYFLINSLDPDLLAANESALIDFYVSELAQRGATLDPAAAREQYRAFSFQTLMVAVTSVGLGALTERDETVRTVLRRSVAAIERLGFGDWLDTL